MDKLKKFKVFDYHFAYLFVLMIIGGISGFLIECIATTVSAGYIDSRFQRLPCIFGYGIVVFILYFILGTPNNMRILNMRLFESKSKGYKHFMYFLISTIFIFFAEWGAGELFELLTGSVLWNYSNIPLHIGKYVCLPFTLGFGLIAYVGMAFVFTPFMNFLEKNMKIEIALLIDLIVGIPVVIDCIVTTTLLAIGKTPKIIWKICFPWYKKKRIVSNMIKLCSL